jgi:hypothetical protein
LLLAAAAVGNYSLTATAEDSALATTADDLLPVTLETPSL